MNNCFLCPRPDWKMNPGKIGDPYRIDKNVRLGPTYARHQRETQRPALPDRSRKPALKVNGKLLACVPVHRSAEPRSLVVRLDFSDRAQLLAEAPDANYVTDHYVGYPAVLVRLSRVNSGVLRDLLRMAHKFATAKTKSHPRGRRRRSPPI